MLFGTEEECYKEQYSYWDIEHIYFVAFILV